MFGFNSTWFFVLLGSVAAQGWIVSWSWLIAACAIAIPILFIFLTNHPTRMACIAIGLGGLGMAFGSIVDQGTFPICNCGCSESQQSLISFSTLLMVVACSLGCCHLSNGRDSPRKLSKLFQISLTNTCMITSMFYGTTIWSNLQGLFSPHEAMLLGMALGTLLGEILWIMGRKQFATYFNR